MKKFLILVLQLSLLLLVIHKFEVVSPTFYEVALLAFSGFAIHHFLPFRYRLPFFLFLSLAAIAAVFGFQQGAWLVGISLVLIGICHLPVSFSVRVTTLLFTGAFLAVLRMGWFHAPWSEAIWPILGSMFMFRLIIYLYDLRHDNAPVSVTRTLSYFFLLPNVCFPLFPVVDYKTFRRTYYNDDPHWIYQTGVQWMLRGITHLILYRFVYYYLTLVPSEVTDIGRLVQYLLSNFLLYLRVSGQFHLIIGMLCLFGFNLPETHQYYYIASSFTDFWRRINIYWKDFMSKVFYYPAFFKLRRWGTTPAIVFSTLFVFFVTWFLHAYQWFWIRGSFLLAWNDVLFWVILALLVVINSLYEVKHGRERTLGRRSWTSHGAVALSLRMVGTFTTICILWSLWTSKSISEWIALWSAVGEVKAGNVMVIPTFLVAAVAFGEMFRDGTGGGKTPMASRRELTFRRPAIVVSALILLYLSGHHAVYSLLGSKVANVIGSLQEARLNKQDTALLERGYYEKLLSVERFNTQLWEVYTKKPLNWVDLRETRAVRLNGGLLSYELVPSIEIPFKGATLRTNRWGMRDKDYERSKPPNTFRIALLGSSHVMGSGVENEETFESLVEERLNRERKGKPYGRYEILNFAVGGYTPLHQLVALERKVSSFEPDAVFYVAHTNDLQSAIDYLAAKIEEGVDVPYGYLRDIAREAGIDGGTEKLVATGRLAPFGGALFSRVYRRIAGGGTEKLVVSKRLGPFGGEVISWVYRRIAEDCWKRGVVPVWILLPRLEENVREEEVAGLIRLAEKAHFIVLNLFDLYQNRDTRPLQVREWDNHPNAKAHRLIADRLYEALQGNEKLHLTSAPLTSSDRETHVDRR